MPTKQYGVPYMGSKSRFAERLMAQMPSAETFVDLFAGGCAMAHCALLAKDENGADKYNSFILNDSDGGGIQLFLDSVNGKYVNEKRWISRSDFFAMKDTDPYVRWCWSFGNCGRTYAYGRDLEHFKKTLHDMLTADSVYDRYIAWHDVVRQIDRDIGSKKLAAGTEQLQDVERLQRLNKLQTLKPRIDGLENENRFTVYTEDYADVDIPPNSLVYCDIPYKTMERKYYGVRFDWDRFYEWCESFAKDRPDCKLIVSEYTMPDSFECIAGINDRCNFSPINNPKSITERLFTVK